MIKKINASGEVSIYKITNGVKSLLLTKHNEIQSPAADSIIAQILSGNLAAMVSKISFYSGFTLAGSKTAERTFLGGGSNSVRFEAMITGADYIGDFNVLLLSPDDIDTYGVFALFTLDDPITLAEEEDNYSVTWRISINPAS